MTYGCIPLFPPGCPRPCREMPEDCGCRPERRPGECQRVCIRNPACPEETAEVELCVDCDGNLSICVHRQPRPCRKPLGDRCGCRCSGWRC